jgi:hypothetical protein
MREQTAVTIRECPILINGTSAVTGRCCPRDVLLAGQAKHRADEQTRAAGPSYDEAVSLLASAPHAVHVGFSSLTAPWRTRGLLAMLIAPRRTFGLESNLRAPLRTSGLEMIFPASIILLTHLPSHLVNLLPKQRLPPFPRRLTPRTRRRLLIMVNRSGARPTVRSRRLLKKAFEATFSIFDGALAST